MLPTPEHNLLTGNHGHLVRVQVVQRRHAHLALLRKMRRSSNELSCHGAWLYRDRDGGGQEAVCLCVLRNVLLHWHGSSVRKGDELTQRLFSRSIVLLPFNGCSLRIGA